jgi:hypothetical protein
MSDELVPAVAPKKKAKREMVYLCSSELQHLQCEVKVIHKDNCRIGCPFLQFRPKGAGLKREKFSKLEQRLVNFEVAFNEVINRWTLKQSEFLRQGRESDAYIVRHIIEMLCEPNLKVGQKKLTDRIFKTKLPLFRSYYKEGREDIKRLRKIVDDHHKVQKEREKRERRAVPAGEETNRVLPAQ